MKAHCIVKVFRIGGYDKDDDIVICLFQFVSHINTIHTRHFNIQKKNILAACVCQQRLSLRKADYFRTFQTVFLKITSDVLPKLFCRQSIIINPNELEEYRDTEAIKAEYPELKDVWENDDAYTDEETAEIFYNNIDIINKYTNMIHFKTRYVFIKCRITNTSDKEMDVYMSNISFILSSPDKEKSLTHDNDMCYFDASSHTQGDDRVHNFFAYTFQPGETLNCTIGFPVKEEIENQEYYFGINNQGDNPVKGNCVIKLYDLEKTEK